MNLKIFLFGFLLINGVGLNAQTKAEKEILNLAKEYQKIYLKNLDSVYLEGDFKSVLTTPRVVLTDENASMAEFKVTSGPYISFVKIVLIKTKSSKSTICVYEYYEGTPLYTAMSFPRSLHFFDEKWQEITTQVLNQARLAKMDSAYQKALQATCTNLHLSDNQVFSKGGEFDLTVGVGGGMGRLELSFSFEGIVRTYGNLCHVYFGRLTFDYENGEISFKAYGEK